MRRDFRLVVAAVLMVLATAGAASAAEPNVDEMFERARELGFGGEREQARELCREILAHSPEYADVRVFLGRLHAWDKQYGEARAAFRRALDSQPNHLDARIAWIDAELWAGDAERALQLSDEGLSRFEDHPELNYRKAKALDKLGRHDEALTPIWRATGRDPYDERLRKLQDSLEFKTMKNKLGIDLGYEWFDDSTDPWTDLRLAYTRRHGWGSIIYRVNLARRFDDNADQYEVEAYPKIPGGGYMYLEGAWSDSGIFPDWRMGAEYFRGLGNGWEGSLGFRHLDFGSTDVTLYTGSIGRYFGNHFVWFRPFVADKDAGTSVSGTIFWRRWFGDPETYITVSAGGGESPDEDLITQEIDRLDSYKLRFEWQKRIRRLWILKGDAGWRRQEFAAGQERDSFQLGFGFQRYF